MKANVICSKFYPGNLFTWNGNQGVAEISDLGPNPLCPVYNDACDVGFGIEGTHREVVFCLNSTETDTEGEITHWEFISISEPGFSVTLLND